MANLSVESFLLVFQGGVSKPPAVWAVAARMRHGAAPGPRAVTRTHMVPSLAAKLQPEVFLLRKVEVAAGEVEQPFSTGFLLANKHTTEAAG